MKGETARKATAGLLAGLSLVSAGVAAGGETGGADTALVIAVDVSSSVDESRFRLQMEGLAAALEDPGVHRAITAGPNGAIMVTLVEWADRPSVAVPWMRLASADDARRLAARIRNTPRRSGNFTCVSAMLHYVSVKVAPLVARVSDRLVVDVSGDGRENCNPATEPGVVRDRLVAGGATVNGLPILEGDEADTLADWYRANVAGGLGAFVLPADGYRDFGRAIRQKFITEISLR